MSALRRGRGPRIPFPFGAAGLTAQHRAFALAPIVPSHSSPFTHPTMLSSSHITPAAHVQIAVLGDLAVARGEETARWYEQVRIYFEVHNNSLHKDNIRRSMDRWAGVSTVPLDCVREQKSAYPSCSRSRLRSAPANPASNPLASARV
jgi:hypothetical protein